MRTRLIAVTLPVLLSLAASAHAAPPPCQRISPANCSIPPGILVVEGSTLRGGWSIDLAGVFTVTLRDAANVPLGGCTVTVDLSSCSEYQGCAGSIPSPPLCPGPVFQLATSPAGVATFDISGFITPGTPSTVGTIGPCAKITAGGVLLGIVPVACFDLDGVNGVSNSDITTFNSIFVTGVPLSRADFDFSGSVTANDLAILSALINAGTSANKTIAPCCH